MLDLGPSWVISIHSLVKRETPRPTIITNFGNHFNPLPRKEGDCCRFATCNGKRLFQSTPS